MLGNTKNVSLYLQYEIKQTLLRSDTQKKMGNMSYCRFENTLHDLKDCFDNMSYTSDLSEIEKKARKEMIELCKDIALDYAYDELEAHFSE